MLYKNTSSSITKIVINQIINSGDLQYNYNFIIYIVNLIHKKTAKVHHHKLMMIYKINIKINIL